MSRGRPRSVSLVLGQLDLDTVRNASLWGVVALVLIALLAVWIIKQVVTKVLTVVVLLALAGLLWSQRAELTDCYDQIGGTIAASGARETTCTFFGRTVTVPSLPNTPAMPGA